MVASCVVGGRTNKVMATGAVETSITLHGLPNQRTESVQFDLWKAFVDRTRKDFVARTKSAMCTQHSTVNSFRNYEVKPKKEMGIIKPGLCKNNYWAKCMLLGIADMTKQICCSLLTADAVPSVTPRMLEKRKAGPSGSSRRRKQRVDIKERQEILVDLITDHRRYVIYCFYDVSNTECSILDQKAKEVDIVKNPIDPTTHKHSYNSEMYVMILALFISSSVLKW